MSAAQFTAENAPVAPRAEPVQRPRDQFLAGAALAFDQHGKRRAGGPRDRLAHGRQSPDCGRGSPATRPGRPGSKPGVQRGCATPGPHSARAWCGLSSVVCRSTGPRTSTAPIDHAAAGLAPPRRRARPIHDSRRGPRRSRRRPAPARSARVHRSAHHQRAVGIDMTAADPRPRAGAATRNCPQAPRARPLRPERARATPASPRPIHRSVPHSPNSSTPSAPASRRAMIDRVRDAAPSIAQSQRRATASRSSSRWLLAHAAIASCSSGRAGARSLGSPSRSARCSRPISRRRTATNGLARRGSRPADRHRPSNRVHAPASLPEDQLGRERRRDPAARRRLARTCDSASVAGDAAPRRRSRSRQRRSAARQRHGIVPPRDPAASGFARRAATGRRVREQLRNEPPRRCPRGLRDDSARLPGARPFLHASSPQQMTTMRPAVGSGEPRCRRGVESTQTHRCGSPRSERTPPTNRRAAGTTRTCARIPRAPATAPPCGGARSARDSMPRRTNTCRTSTRSTVVRVVRDVASTSRVRTRT